jgi:hypothetical protein
MIREALERVGVAFAGVAALVVFLSLCIEPLRSDFARYSAIVLAAYAAAFFLAITCDGRIHRVLSRNQLSLKFFDAKWTWFGEGESTTVGVLRHVLFVEFWLALFMLGSTATTLAAISGYVIAVMLGMCEYVRWKQRDLAGDL